MTNRAIDPRSRRAVPLARRALTLSALALTLFAAACEKKKAEAPAPPPPPPPPPAPVKVSASELEMDPRVQFPESTLPTDRQLAQAVASLATALVKGDGPALSAMLDDSARAVLTGLEQSGDWSGSTKGIQAVRVVALAGDDAGAKVGLGVQDAKGAYLLAWSGKESSGAWTFTGLPITPRTATRVADLDGVALDVRAVPEPAAEAAKAASRDPRAIQAEKDAERNKGRSPSKTGGGGGGSRPSSPRPPELPGGR